MKKYECIRGIKYLLEPNSEQREELEEFVRRLNKAVNSYSKIIYKKLFSISDLLTFKDIKYQGYADTLWKEYPDICPSLGLLLQRHRRSTANQARMFFHGYMKRNHYEVPSAIPSLKQNKSNLIADGIVKDKDPTKKHGKITITTHKGKMDVPYRIYSGSIQNKLSIKNPKEMAGWLCCQKGQWFFSTRCVKTKTWAYLPEAPLGFDINKTSEDFVVFSKEVEVSPNKYTMNVGHSDEIIRLQEVLRILNKEIKECSKSSQRRGIRRKVIKLHKKLNKLYGAFREFIIGECRKNKYLLCIDNLTCGANMGSFGQDKLVQPLKELCENKGIPFVMVDTRNTSIICNTCQVKGKRISPEILDCPNCGEIAAQYNAPKNIADKGWKEWEKRVEEWEEENIWSDV